MFLLYFYMTVLVLLYYSISTSFSAVTPSSLSDRDLAWAWSFYLYFISSYNVKVFLSNQFQIESFYLFNCFLFILNSFRWSVYFLNFQFYYLFICLVYQSCYLRLCYRASADYLWALIISYYRWSCAAYLLNFQQLADVESKRILALDIFAANQFNIFLSCIPIKFINLDYVSQNKDAVNMIPNIFRYCEQDNKELLVINKIMSHKRIEVDIEICSDCQQHKWYTRHDQAQYNNTASQLMEMIVAKDPSIEVTIYKVGKNKVGSFQVLCNGRVIFSKLKLGYMPDVVATTDKLISYVADLRDQKEVKRYSSNERMSFSANKQRSRVSQNNSQKQFTRSGIDSKSTSKLTGNNSYVHQKNTQTQQKQKKRRDQARQDIKRKRFQLIQQYKKKYPNYDINMGVKRGERPMTSNQSQGRSNMNRNQSSQYNRDQVRGYEVQTQSFKNRLKARNIKLKNSESNSQSIVLPRSPQKNQTKTSNIIVGGNSTKNKQENISINKAEQNKQTIKNPQEVKV